MKKAKKSDLRYGDRIKFSSPIDFGRNYSSLHGTTPAFSADTFDVDVRPPSRGKKLPEYELRRPEDPMTVCQVKKWPEFEIVSRLPDDVKVFKSDFRATGTVVSCRSLVLRPDGTTWDDRAIVAQKAMQYARELGCAVVVFRDFGYAEVWPWHDGVPGAEFLLEQLHDPYSRFEGYENHRLGNGYLVYSAENASAVARPIRNYTARYALINDPDLMEIEDYTDCELNRQEVGQVMGHVAVLVGFSTDPQSGKTIRTPIGQHVKAA